MKKNVKDYNWSVYEYELGVVAFPNNDKREHTFFSSCWCNPYIKTEHNGKSYQIPLYIHHSLDWRELDESFIYDTKIL